MNPPVITAVTAWVPDAIPLSHWTVMESAQSASGRAGWDAWVRSWQPDHRQWLEACRGEETGGSGPANPDPALPDMSCMVPVETRTGLSGLAAKAAKAICATRTQSARPVDVVVFCHSSLDEDIPTTIAGRLCAEIGTPCFPFSVSQQHGVSPFTALRLATDLFIAEPDIHTTLIVAAEKWCPPFSRICGPTIVHGDAAAAMILERTDHGTGGLRLLDVAARHVPADIRLGAPNAHDANTFALLSMIESLLARHGLRHAEIDEVVGHPCIPSLTATVCNQFGRPGIALQHEPCVHLGAADPIVRLAQTLTRATRCRTPRLLLWGFGLGDFTGTALLEMGGVPFPSQQYDTRSIS